MSAKKMLMNEDKTDQSISQTNQRTSLHMLSFARRVFMHTQSSPMFLKLLGSPVIQSSEVLDKGVPSPQVNCRLFPMASAPTQKNELTKTEIFYNHCNVHAMIKIILITTSITGRTFKHDIATFYCILQLFFKAGEHIY